VGVSSIPPQRDREAPADSGACPGGIEITHRLVVGV
jgi:hypothetical protein